MRTSLSCPRPWLVYVQAGIGNEVVGTALRQSLVSERHLEVATANESWKSNMLIQRSDHRLCTAVVRAITHAYQLINDAIVGVAHIQLQHITVRI